MELRTQSSTIYPPLQSTNGFRRPLNSESVLLTNGNRQLSTLLVAPAQDNQTDFRINSMKSDLHDLQSEISRRKSTKLKYKRAFTSLSVIEGLTIATEVALGIIGCIPGIGIPALVIQSIMGTGIAMNIFYMLGSQQILKKKHKHDKIECLTKEVYDAQKIAFSKATEDGVISHEEFLGFQKSLNVYKEAVSQIQDKATPHALSDNARKALIESGIEKGKQLMTLPK